MQPNDLLGDIGHVESRFSPFGDSVSVECKIGARFCTFVSNVPKAQKSFKMHPMVLLGDEALVEAQFGLFGDSANLDLR